MAGLVALPLVVLGVLFRRHRSRALGAWWGLGLAVLAVFGERWFSRPPPHQEVHALQGSAWVYAGMVLVTLALCAIFARWGRTWLLALVLGLLAVGVGFSERTLSAAGQVRPGSPDVILVTIDTLRADHVGAYGNRTVWTPAMDGLAEAGARFQAASAQIAVTGPSHLTMLSGQGPWQHGVLLNGMPVPEGIGWLPEALRASGWRTGAFISAYVLDGSHGFSRGFEVYEDDFGQLPGWADTAPGRIGAMIGRKLRPIEVLERSAEDTVDRALMWRQSVEDGPVFMWVHLFDPHGPYEPPEPWDTAYYTGDPTDPAHTSMDQATGIPPYMGPSLAGIRDTAWVRAQYAGEVSAADQALGRLLEKLPGADDALVVVVGDHGESLGEHGVWFHHGGDLQTPELAIPMIVRYPAAVSAGAVVSGPVELTDLAVTVAELLGIEAPSGGDGLSLVDAMRTGNTPRGFARGLCFDRPANQAAREAGLFDRPKYRVGTVRGLSTRLISRDAPGGSVERWDRRGGLEVSVPLTILGLPPTPEIQLMLNEVQALVHSGVDAGVARDDATIEKLRALGYVE
jgi:arylsulfatase